MQFQDEVEKLYDVVECWAATVVQVGGVSLIPLSGKVEPCWFAAAEPVD